MFVNGSIFQELNISGSIHYFSPEISTFNEKSNHSFNSKTFFLTKLMYQNNFKQLELLTIRKRIFHFNHNPYKFFKKKKNYLKLIFILKNLKIFLDNINFAKKKVLLLKQYENWKLESVNQLWSINQS